MQATTIIQGVFSLLSLVAAGIALPQISSDSPTLPLPSRVLYQFPKGSWIENLAVRSDGDLLLDLMSTPNLYLLNPRAENSEPQLLHTFPDSLGLLGITEMQHDIFYVITGNFSLTTGSDGPGTYALWKVELRGHHNDTKAVVQKVTDIPEARLLNSVIPLYEDGAGDVVLISDSDLGVVWQVDVRTGNHSILLDFPEMKYPPGAPLPIGINGLRLRDGYLYWANSEQDIFCRVKVDCSGKASGAVEVLVRNTTFIDDFVFDTEGTAWVALDTSWELGTIEMGQQNVTIVLGSSDQLTVAGPTSVRFGRGSGFEDTLYVATSGGLASPRNGTIYEGAKVLAVDTRAFDAYNYRTN
jgi:hypothetical protein